MQCRFALLKLKRQGCEQHRFGFGPQTSGRMFYSPCAKAGCSLPIVMERGPSVLPSLMDSISIIASLSRVPIEGTVQQDSQADIDSVI